MSLSPVGTSPFNFLQNSGPIQEKSLPSLIANAIAEPVAFITLCECPLQHFERFSVQIEGDLGNQFKEAIKFLRRENLVNCLTRIHRGLDLASPKSDEKTNTVRFYLFTMGAIASVKLAENIEGTIQLLHQLVEKSPSIEMKKWTLIVLAHSYLKLRTPQYDKALETASVALRFSAVSHLENQLSKCMGIIFAAQGKYKESADYFKLVRRVLLGKAEELLDYVMSHDERRHSLEQADDRMELVATPTEVDPMDLMARSTDVEENLFSPPFFPAIPDDLLNHLIRNYLLPSPQSEDFLFQQAVVGRKWLQVIPPQLDRAEEITMEAITNSKLIFGSIACIELHINLLFIAALRKLNPQVLYAFDQLVKIAPHHALVKILNPHLEFIL